MTLSLITVATPLGPIKAVTSTDAVYLLEFSDCPGLNKDIEHLERTMRTTVVTHQTPITALLETELSAYFAGTLSSFTVPIVLQGTPFQRLVWQTLTTIPCGHTQSYASIAHTINKPTAFRAVALANSMNKIALIVPCHRVIRSNGHLSGYASGVERKKWLLNHEKQMTA